MKLFDVQTTADFLGTSRQTVDRLISSGALPAIVIRSGRRKKIMRVRDDVLKKFLGIAKTETLIIEPAIIHKKEKESKAKAKAVTLAVVDAGKHEQMV